MAGTILYCTFVSLFHIVTTTFRGWLISSLSIVLSAAMIFGLLTPVISCLIILNGVLFLVFVPEQLIMGFEVYLIILSSIVILLGPGAYSLDARLFGLREIVVTPKAP